MRGTQPLQPGPPFWNSRHFNVLSWHKVRVEVMGKWAGSVKERERGSQRTSNGCYSPLQACFSLLCGSPRRLPRQPPCAPMVCRHCRSHTQGKRRGITEMCVWERDRKRDMGWGGLRGSLQYSLQETIAVILPIQQNIPSRPNNTKPDINMVSSTNTVAMRRDNEVFPLLSCSIVNAKIQNLFIEHGWLET